MAHMDAAKTAVVPLSCPKCPAKYTVHVQARTGFRQITPYTIMCVKCGTEILVPHDKIVAGPFLVEGEPRVGNVFDNRG